MKPGPDGKNEEAGADREDNKRLFDKFIRASFRRLFYFSSKIPYYFSMMIQEQIFYFEKFLSLLGVQKSNPTYDFLCKLIKAYLIKIPFENISKLLQKKRGFNYMPPLSEYLDGIEKFNFGGTCYANNYYLNLLLDFLGYDVKLCGADMKDPDVHLINIVNIDKKEFLVDCGYAAPFYNPLPLMLKYEYTINFGEEKYVIKPRDSQGHTRVEQYIHGRQQHWYTAKPAPRKIGEFKDIIEDSYSKEATFMNAIRITRFKENGSAVLQNLSLTEFIDDKTSIVKFDRKDLPKVVEQKFGMPASTVSEATNHLRDLRDIYD